MVKDTEVVLVVLVALVVLVVQAVNMRHPVKQAVLVDMVPVEVKEVMAHRIAGVDAIRGFPAEMVVITEIKAVMVRLELLVRV